MEKKLSMSVGVEEEGQIEGLKQWVVVVVCMKEDKRRESLREFWETHLNFHYSQDNAWK